MIFIRYPAAADAPPVRDRIKGLELEIADRHVLDAEFSCRCIVRRAVSIGKDVIAPVLELDLAALDRRGAVGTEEPARHRAGRCQPHRDRDSAVEGDCPFGPSAEVVRVYCGDGVSSLRQVIEHNNAVWLRPCPGRIIGVARAFHIDACSRRWSRAVPFDDLHGHGSFAQEPDGHRHVAPAGDGHIHHVFVGRNLVFSNDAARARRNNGRELEVPGLICGHGHISAAEGDRHLYPCSDRRIVGIQDRSGDGTDSVCEGQVNGNNLAVCRDAAAPGHR